MNRAAGSTRLAAPAAPEPALGVLDELIGYHLRRASGVMAADFARTVADSGVRQVLFGILSIVAANPGINQGAVGRLLGIQRANMVYLVNQVIERGWVARTVAVEDRRSFELKLTPCGQTLLGDVMERLRRHEAALMADLSVAERDSLIDLLRRIERREAPPQPTA